MQFSSGSSALSGGSPQDSSSSPRISAFEQQRHPEARPQLSSLEELRDQYSALNNKLDALLAERRQARSESDRLAVRNVGRILLVDPAELLWIEAADNYVKLHTPQDVHV